MGGAIGQVGAVAERVQWAPEQLRAMQPSLAKPQALPSRLAVPCGPLVLRARLSGLDGAVLRLAGLGCVGVCMHGLPMAAACSAPAPPLQAAMVKL